MQHKKAAVFILLGQSNAVGHGIPMEEKDDTDIEPDLSDEFCVYTIDKDHLIAKTEWDPRRFVLRENTVAMIKNF